MMDNNQVYNSEVPTNPFYHLYKKHIIPKGPLAKLWSMSSKNHIRCGEEDNQ